MSDVQLYVGDCAVVMAEHIADNSIDLTVTSPPYDNLRTYNGYTFDFEAIAAQLWRVTKPGGVVVWVVGDETIDGCETLVSFGQAQVFKRLGFAIETMIYQKTGTTANFASLPRYAHCFEFMFVCVKGKKPNTFNPIMQKNKLAGRSRDKEVTRTQRNGEIRSYGAAASGKYSDYSFKRNVWIYDTGSATGDDKLAFDHPAPFPEALARDHILSWSNPGDVVLDPMMGSGTTGKMARLTGRRFIGIDISAEYVELARQRIAKVEAQPFLFHPAETQPQAQQMELVA